MNFPVYLLMVSYGKPFYGLSVIRDFLKAKKPDTKTRFIVIENSEKPDLNKMFAFSEHPDLLYYHFENKNKAAAINFAVKDLIDEEEAIIIAIDNDIKFDIDYLIKYYKAALAKGNQFYFGTSFFVNFPNDVAKNLVPFLQGSARGKPDAEFKKMKNLMFLGFSYAFFKEQWKAVGGLDERFSPGSQYGLAAEESVFQKKLKHAGYIPFLIENNAVEHLPVPESYEENWVLKRQENNGFTHGFQDLISTNFLQFTYPKKLFFFIQRTITLFPKRENKLAGKMNAAYIKGYFKAFLLFLNIKNKKSFLKF